MRKRILFLTLSGLGLATPSFFFITSCKEKTIPNEYDQFISDRTFSICATGNKEGRAYWVRGTAWIINKKNSVSNYEYYIATNWHVELGFEDINASPLTISYCDSNYLTYYGQSNDYTKFHSISRYGDDCTYDGDKKHAIDMYIYDADFGNANDLKPKYKNKLDRINEYYLQHENHINNFITGYEKSTYYIGGYPVGSKNDAPAKWEVHEINDSQSIAYNDSEWSHAIDGEEHPQNPQIIDISPQYIFPGTKTNWMSSGASGSMIINKDKDICGIYWGGWQYQDNKGKPLDKFAPCASIFNSSVKNFVFGIM